MVTAKTKSKHHKTKQINHRPMNTLG